MKNTLLVTCAAMVVTCCQANASSIWELGNGPPGATVVGTTYVATANDGNQLMFMGFGNRAALAAGIPNMHIVVNNRGGDDGGLGGTDPVYDDGELYRSLDGTVNQIIAVNTAGYLSRSIEAGSTTVGEYWQIYAGNDLAHMHRILFGSNQDVSIPIPDSAGPWLAFGNARISGLTDGTPTVLWAEFEGTLDRGRSAVPGPIAGLPGLLAMGLALFYRRRRSKQ